MTMTHQSSRDAAGELWKETSGNPDTLPNCPVAFEYLESFATHFERHREMVIAEVSDELKRLRSLAAKVFDHLDYRTGSAPGHGHKTPGVWDMTGNPPERAGKPCEWCALWNDFRSAIYQGTAHD
jgi:hypothetical protein